MTNSVAGQRVLPTAGRPENPAAPFPRGVPLRLDGGVQRHGVDGRVVTGGSPRRVLRLSASGARVLDTLLSSGAATQAAAVLARTLTDGGLAHPVTAGRADPDWKPTVVIPVHDRPQALGRCLATLGARWPVIVVDDGSSPAAAADTRAVVAEHGATLVRRETPGGPGVARNAGLALVETEFAVLLDSDCAVTADDLLALSAQFVDPLVGAAAPRVCTTRGRRSVLERYAASRSPLDMGERPRRVAAGTEVSYLPTAALALRMAALGEGFDPALRYGEDVDFVWRMLDAGWRVRYDPDVVVDHDDPTTWGELLRRRFAYGSSAGPLAERHGGRLAPVILRPWPTLAAGLLLARRPVLAAAVVGGQGIVLGRRLRRAGAPPQLGLRWTAEAVADTLDGLARTASMFASPLLIMAAIREPRLRAPLGLLLLGSAARAWLRTDRRTDFPRFAAASVADDIAYGSGVWAGALRARTPAALLPNVSRGEG